MWIRLILCWLGLPNKLAQVHNYDFNVNINGTRLQKVDHCKHLGVEIDDNLMWLNHIEQVRKKVLTGLYFLRKASNCIPKHHQSMLYKSIIAPHFDYCNVVWGRCNKTLCSKLQVLQNRAAKIITAISRYGSSTQLFETCNGKVLMTNYKWMKQLLGIKLSITKHQTIFSIDLPNKKPIITLEIEIEMFLP